MVHIKKKNLKKKEAPFATHSPLILLYIHSQYLTSSKLQYLCVYFLIVSPTRR